MDKIKEGYKERLVDSYAQALESAKNFSMGNHIDKLTSFKHWYYIEEIDSFVPSKFMGYKKMTSEDYDYYTDWEGRYDSDEPYLDGRETQKVFKKNKWFIETEDQSIWEKLQEKLNSYNKKIRKGSVIYIRR